MQPQAPTGDSKPEKFLKDSFLVPLIAPTLKTGIATGLLGLVGGGIYGLFHAPRAGPFAGAVAAQSFYYGASISVFRSAILAGITENEKTSAKLFASGTAGVASGIIASRWQKAPAGRTALIIGLLSLTTQASYDALYSRYAQSPERRPLLERISNSPWMPLRSVPDSEYEDILQGRIDKIAAEIALVDSQLESLQRRKDQLLIKRR